MIRSHRPSAPPWSLALLGLLNLRHAHLVDLVACLGYCVGVLLLPSQGTLVALIHCLHSVLVGLGVLLLDELLDKCQTLAHVLGLGLDFRNRELGLDVHLLDL